MKDYINIMVILFAFILICSDGFANNYPTEEQVNKLVESVWKEPPYSIDVTLYKEMTLPQESEEEIRQRYEDIFNSWEGAKEKLSPVELEIRNATVQMNVESILQERKVGRKIKQRIRIDGYRQRIDQAFGWPKISYSKKTGHEEVRPEVVLDSNTPYDITQVNLGDVSKGDYTSFVYYHKQQTTFISNSPRSMWTKSAISDLAGLPEEVCLSMKIMMLGKKQDSPSGASYVPDKEKIKKVSAAGELGRGLISIITDPNKPDARDKIIISYPSEPNGFRTTIVCDRKDYSRIYLLDKSNPTTGQILYRRECDSFDSQGFPHNATIIERDKKGNITKTVYRIETVTINPVIPKEVFEFNPPEDYQIVQVDPNGTNRIVREKGGPEGEFLKFNKAMKAKDIGALKDFLGNKSPKIRLMSLQVLKYLLLQNKEDLKSVASNLKNDSDPNVRRQAEEIISSLEASKFPNLPGKQ